MAQISVTQYSDITPHMAEAGLKTVDGLQSTEQVARFTSYLQALHPKPNLGTLKNVVIDLTASTLAADVGSGRNSFSCALLFPGSKTLQEAALQNTTRVGTQPLSLFVHLPSNQEVLHLKGIASVQGLGNGQYKLFSSQGLKLNPPAAATPGTPVQIISPPVKQPTPSLVEDSVDLEDSGEDDVEEKSGTPPPSSGSPWKMILVGTLCVVAVAAIATVGYRYIWPEGFSLPQTAA